MIHIICLSIFIKKLIFNFIIKNRILVYNMLSATEFKKVINTKFENNNQFLDSKTAKKNLKIVRDYSALEPLLQEEQRLCIFPVIHDDVMELYHRQEGAFWSTAEIDMSCDREDFMKLDSDTQHFIKNVLGFFATADGAVILNINDNFINDIKNNEIQLCYNYQVMMEGIHSQMYAILIREIISEDDERHRLYDAVNTVPCIQAKNAWGQKWAYSGAPFVQRLVANAIVEGIFFSGSFCAIFWLKERNIMPGLCQSNELISRDENMHCELPGIINKKLLYPMAEKDIKEMVDDALDIEKNFINDSLRCDKIGMNTVLMSQYLEYIADVTLLKLGYSKMYYSENPFGFMEDINFQIKTNFFEKKTTTYQRPQAVTGNTEISEDF